MGIDQTDKFEALRCPSALILGEHSTDEGAYFADHMIRVAPYALPSITLYETHHHFMLEEPIATVSAIEAGGTVALVRTIGSWLGATISSRGV